MVAKDVSRQATSQAKIVAEGRCRGGREHPKPGKGHTYCPSCRKTRSDRATAKREKMKRAAESACGPG